MFTTNCSMCCIIKSSNNILVRLSRTVQRLWDSDWWVLKGFAATIFLLNRRWRREHLVWLAFWYLKTQYARNTKTIEWFARVVFTSIIQLWHVALRIATEFNDRCNRNRQTFLFSWLCEGMKRVKRRRSVTWKETQKKAPVIPNSGCKLLYTRSS